MEDFQQRVLQEHKDLSEKIVKLLAFLSKPDLIDIADDKEIELLMEQVFHMQKYQETLQARINRFPKEE